MKTEALIDEFTANDGLLEAANQSLTACEGTLWVKHTEGRQCLGATPFLVAPVGENWFSYFDSETIGAAKFASWTNQRPLDDAVKHFRDKRPVEICLTPATFQYKDLRPFSGTLWQSDVFRDGAFDDIEFQATIVEDPLMWLAYHDAKAPELQYTSARSPRIGIDVLKKGPKWHFPKEFARRFMRSLVAGLRESLFRDTLAPQGHQRMFRDAKRLIEAQNAIESPLRSIDQAARSLVSTMEENADLLARLHAARYIGNEEEFDRVREVIDTLATSITASASSMGGRLNTIRNTTRDIELEAPRLNGRPMFSLKVRTQSPTIEEAVTSWNTELQKATGLANLISLPEAVRDEDKFPSVEVLAALGDAYNAR